MKFLVDESLSHRVAEALRSAGHDAIHVVADLHRGGSPDPEILALAREELRVIVAADTDFGELLALGQDALPSVVLFRREQRRPHEQAQTLLDNLDQFRDALESGAIVVIESQRIRVRLLPIADANLG